jgi:hypothetical protein
MVLPAPAGNSYITPAEAQAHLAVTFGGATWASIDPASQAVALSEASRALDALPWIGTKANSAQPWAWPRVIPAHGDCPAVGATTLPAAVVQAVAELALALHANQGAINPSMVANATLPDPNLGPIKRQKLGELEQEFFSPHERSQALATGGNSGAHLLRQFPWLSAVLRCLVVPLPDASGSKVLARCGCDGVRRYDGLYLQAAPFGPWFNSAGLMPLLTGGVAP